MAEYQVAKRMRGGWRKALLGLLLASCGDTTNPDNGSETHFLLRCFEGCGEGFECLSGVCTRDCETDVECSELSPAAICAGVDEGCRVLCDTKQDCTEAGDDWVCDAGQCVSSRPPIDAPECPRFEGGVKEPTARATSHTEVPRSENTAQAVADDDGLFWRDDSGAVRGLVDSEPIDLQPALEEVRTAMGMLTDATTLYFADAGPPWMGPPAEPHDPPPPGRLFAVPKTGGPVELLLELEDATLTPLAVIDGGVVIRSDDRLYVVGDEGVELLEHVPPIPVSYELWVVDGRAYWSSWGSMREPTQLFAVDLAGGEPEVIAEINGALMVGHGRVLWQTETIVEDPLVLVNELMMLDLETGCITELPSRGESMGTPVFDARHVYWKSYNGLDDGGDDVCLDPLPLIRANFTRGMLEQLSVEDFDVTLCTDFMAQNDDTLFMRKWQGHSLIAIAKP